MGFNFAENVWLSATPEPAQGAHRADERGSSSSCSGAHRPGLLTLLIVSVLVFAITALLPGDAAQAVLGQDATPDAVAALRAQMGLDQPGAAALLRWLGGLVRGDLGTSSSTTCRSRD